jgi:hypothetical protein
MSRYSDYEAPSSATDWVMNTVRRNPEGLLLFAAGCALLMRSGASPLSRKFSENSYGDNAYGGHSGPSRQSGMREGITRTAGEAADYVSDVKDRIAETASSYASSVTDYAEETRRNISDQSTRLKRQAQSSLQTGVDRMLREQPLAVVLLGVAAGAAVASVFPTTDVESQALGTTRDALADAANKAGESIVGAAGAAGERLKSAAAEHGLNTEGLKEIARDVAGTFSDAVTGKPDEGRSVGAGAAGASPSNSNPRIVPKSSPPNSQPSGSRGGQPSGSGMASGNSPSPDSDPSLRPQNNKPGDTRGNR